MSRVSVRESSRELARDSMRDSMRDSLRDSLRDSSPYSARDSLREAHVPESARDSAYEAQYAALAFAEHEAVMDDSTSDDEGESTFARPGITPDAQQQVQKALALARDQSLLRAQRTQLTGRTPAFE